MKVEVPKSLHGQIAKAQNSLFFIVVAATIVTVFSLVSTKSLLSQGSYQRNVINQRNKAVKQLKDNLTAAKQLQDQYNTVFENSGPINIIGGKNDSSPNAVPPDGDNARIVLDALPSSYDFPALVTSLTKILQSDNINNPSVGGSDQGATLVATPSASPQPASMDVPISGVASFANIQKLLADLQRSIRPFDITSLQVNGGASNMSFSFTMTTYFQPGMSLDVGSKKVK
jgi:hypothetical protein